MNRTAAVTRIQDGLGFASRQEAKIVLRLQEAQRELEMGKTFPKFLLQQLQPLTLVINTDTVALPTRFLRVDDSVKPFYVKAGSTSPTYIPIVRDYYDARIYYAATVDTSPKVMVIRKADVHFINQADANYTIYWNYYKGAELLTTDIENEWLLNAPEWLIGEAGWRMAMDARDKDAVTIFDTMRRTARAAVFGEVVASEEASYPLIMGANL